MAALLETPLWSAKKLKKVLSDLCGGPDISDEDAEKHLFALAPIIGQWRAEQGRIREQEIKTALERLAADLTRCVTVLSASNTGFQSGINIAVALRVRSSLSDDGRAGSSDAAREILQKFAESSRRIIGACSEAEATLSNARRKAGRKKKTWHDDFTILLLRIAKKAAIRPTLYNRGNDDPSGWLVRAATKFEKALPKEMRSPSAVARAKRLTKSKAALRGKNRNP